MILNYKSIPYLESFISYPDIKSLLDHYSIPYDRRMNPPSPTLPAIVHYGPDGKIVKALCDSMDIAKYLDSQWPDRPVITTPPSYPYNTMLESYYSAFRLGLIGMWRTGFNIVIPGIPSILDDRGRKYFIEDRKGDDEQGRSPEDWGAEDPEDDWKPFEASIKQFARLLEHTKESEENSFLLGREPCYSDFVLVAFFTWYKRANEEHWERIMDVVKDDGDVLRRHYRACEKWVDGQGEGVEWQVPGQ
jgi:glutathione S-transferase